MTAFIYVRDSKNIRVYNNLLVANNGDFMYNGFLFFEVVGSNLTGIVAANNTIIGGNNGFGNGSCLYAEGVTGATIENNLLSNCPVLMWGVNGSTYTALNNNVYQNSPLSNSWQIGGSAGGGGSVYSSLASWQSATGAEGNSKATSGSLNLSPTFQPLSGSLAIGAGANLTSLGITALDTAKGGTPRPASGAWDAGAYAFNSGTSSAPAPPTNLKAVAQ